MELLIKGGREPIQVTAVDSDDEDDDEVCRDHATSYMKPKMMQQV